MRMLRQRGTLAHITSLKSQDQSWAFDVVANRGTTERLQDHKDSADANHERAAHRASSTLYYVPPPVPPLRKMMGLESTLSITVRTERVAKWQVAVSSLPL